MLYTVVGGSILIEPYEVTILASKYDSGAALLMAEDVIVRVHFLAALFPVGALEPDLAQEITSYAVDFIELRVGAAERAVIGVLGEPLDLAARTDGLFADLAL